MTRETSTNATLNFHMKHIDSKVCRKILDQTGFGILLNTNSKIELMTFSNAELLTVF